MTVLLVAGGTGQAGSAVVREALARGFEVRSLSRRVPPSGQALDGVVYVSADAATGEGLAAALDGVDVVVDALEGRRGKAQKRFAEAGQRLLAASQGSGVKRAVMLSIAQCDQLPLGYYRSKAQKELVYGEAKLPTAIVRAAQFHSLVDSIFRSTQRLRIVPSVRSARLQPIDVRDAARALVDAASEEFSGHSLRTVGGPEIRPLREFAEQWREATGSPARILEFPVPGNVGRYFSEGRNIAPGSGFGTITFGQWLAELQTGQSNLS